MTTQQQQQPTLLGWLGRPHQDALPRPRARTPSPPRLTAPPTRMVLGVLGTRNSIRYDDFIADIIGPALEAWGVPDEIVAPAESESSHVLSSWAARQGVPVSLVAADWARTGRRAGLLRDARIQREATHFLLLQGPRSNALSTLAGRLQRKGKTVAISKRPGEPLETLSTM